MESSYHHIDWETTHTIIKNYQNSLDQRVNNMQTTIARVILFLKLIDLKRNLS